jgi:hypothetical protein
MSGTRRCMNPLRLFRKTPWNSDSLYMICPVCGWDFVHPVGAYTRMGSDPFEAKVYKGTRAKGKTDNRRSALVCTFHCENGHDFELVISQHKGQNFVSLEELPRESDNEGEDSP